jgi:hypothetical protein
MAIRRFHLEAADSTPVGAARAVSHRTITCAQALDRPIVRVLTREIIEYVDQAGRRQKRKRSEP